MTVVPDGSTIFGGRVVWDNDTPAKCTTCGFIGKVADFEPADSYSPENEAEWEKKIARGDYDLRCQPRGDPIEDETEIKRITDALLRAYPPRSQDNEPKASPAPETYGFDIEGERRREAGFPEEIRRRRWTVEA